MTLPILLVTPHSSGFAPTDILGEMLGDLALDAEQRDARLGWLFSEGDPFTDVIFHTPDVLSLHATVSRFVVDVNRDRAQPGENGVIKLTDFEQRPLYPDGFILTPEARERRLRRYWDSFHGEIDTLLASGDVHLLIDGHSMQPHGPAIGPDRGRPRPALTLMTAGNERGERLSGRSHTSVPPHVARALVPVLETHFGPVIREIGTVPPTIALNDPWQVDEISYRYSAPTREHAVPGFGLEINRALYLRRHEHQEVPMHDAISALNRAFRAFARDALTLVEEAR